MSCSHSDLQLGDNDDEVRHSAVNLLRFICDKYFADTGGDTYNLSNNTHVYDTVHEQQVWIEFHDWQLLTTRFKYLFSKRLANDHPELTLSLFEEVMQRMTEVVTLPEA